MRRWPVVMALCCVAVVLLFPGTGLADPARGDLRWYSEAMRLPQAQELADGGGITVAVVDTGVDAFHPDLAGRVLRGATITPTGVEPGGDFDPDGHGTAMAGLIAGDSDSGDELIGVAPKAHVLPVRIARGEDGTLDTDLVYRGVRWAIDQGARVVNLSLAGEPTVDAEWKRDLIGYAIDHDAVIVAAVGNRADPHDHPMVGEPASIPGVVAVSGMGRDGLLWGGSAEGDSVVLCAPAEDVPHIRPGGGVRPASGTSAATALVSGTAALIESRYPGSSAGDVISRLIDTAVDAGQPGRDRQFGFGVVDAYSALTAAVAPNRDYFPLDLPALVAPAAETESMGGWWLAAPLGLAGTATGGLAVWVVRRLRHRPLLPADVLDKVM